MKDDLVERVARAIRTEDKAGLVDGTGWDGIDEYWRERYRKLARAAIAALTQGKD